jgi:F0F1-type ATP synthase assembly protein I
LHKIRNVESEGVTFNGVRRQLDPKVLAAKRDLNRGFGDALSRATEIALLPAVFGSLGWAIDRWLGTTPLFLIVLLVFSFAGLLVRTWVGYDAEMRRHEEAMTSN